MGPDARSAIIMHEEPDARQQSYLKFVCTHRKRNGFIFMKYACNILKIFFIPKSVLNFIIEQRDDDYSLDYHVTNFNTFSR